MVQREGGALLAELARLMRNNGMNSKLDTYDFLSLYYRAGIAQGARFTRAPQRRVYTLLWHANLSFCSPARSSAQRPHYSDGRSTWSPLRLAVAASQTAARARGHMLLVMSC